MILEEGDQKVIIIYFTPSGFCVLLLFYIIYNNITPSVLKILLMTNLPKDDLLLFWSASYNISDVFYFINVAGDYFFYIFRVIIMLNC